MDKEWIPFVKSKSIFKGSYDGLGEPNAGISLSIHLQDKDIIISEIDVIVTLYDIYGRILQKESSDGRNDVRLTVPNQGIYFVVVGDNLYKIRVK